MCIAAMKMHHGKLTSTIIHYRKFKDINKDAFIKDNKTLLLKSCNKEAICLSRH